MSVARSALVRGPAIVTWNGITMYSDNDIAPKIAPVWQSVKTSMYGEIDKTKTDLIIACPIRLWGAWENLSVLFPAAAMNPTVGASLYGASDLPLVMTGRNGDQVTIVNAQITQLANLFLGVNNSLFAADVMFTGLLADGANPEDAASYYTTGVSQTFTETTFSKVNFKRVRFTGAWGSKAGFTAIVPQKGVQVNWQWVLTPVPVDGYGTKDMTIGGMIANARGIPIVPTMAQLKTQSVAESAHGALLSANSADLVWTGSGGSPVITLKNAGMVEHSLMFGVEPLRNGEVMWETTRGFTTGVPQAVGVVA
jgi:hypothetical protein